MFVKRNSNGSVILILTYVAYVMFISNGEDNLETDVDAFLQEFGGTQEDLSWYLGVYIEFCSSLCLFSQSAYISQSSGPFGLQNQQVFNTPMASSFFEDLDVQRHDKVITGERFQNMIGCLHFLARQTSPDVATAVGILSRSSANPTSFLLKSVKRVLQSLRATHKHVLRFYVTAANTDILKFYLDADFAGNVIDRKSRSGCLGKCFRHLFLWSSCRQNCICLSTSKAEYVSLCEVCCGTK